MSGEGSVTIVAHWRMSDDRVDGVLALVDSLRQATLAEPGCLGYAVYRSIADASELLLVERYRDDAALDAHRRSVHYQTIAVERIIPLLSGRQIDILQTRNPG